MVEQGGGGSGGKGLRMVYLDPNTFLCMTPQLFVLRAAAKYFKGLCH